jgi:hypothetical protein
MTIDNKSPVPPGLSLSLKWLLGIACGLLMIGASIGLPSGSRGLIVALPLTGYGVGLPAIVPLGDLIENRKLVLTLVSLEGCATKGLFQAQTQRRKLITFVGGPNFPITASASAAPRGRNGR